MSGRGSCLIVMAGLGPAIHVFAGGMKERRGWPAFAGHDDRGAATAPVEAFIPRRALRCGASASDRFLIDPTIRWCGDERPERVDKCHWPKSGRTAGMGGEETFFVIRPVDPSK